MHLLLNCYHYKLLFVSYVLLYFIPAFYKWFPQWLPKQLQNTNNYIPYTCTTTFLVLCCQKSAQCPGKIELFRIAKLYFQIWKRVTNEKIITQNVSENNNEFNSVRHKPYSFRKRGEIQFTFADDSVFQRCLHSCLDSSVVDFFSWKCK